MGVKQPEQPGLHNAIIPDPEAGQEGQEQPLTWVQPKEAAEIARLSQRTIYSWVEEGHVQAERRPIAIILYRVCVPLEQVLAYKDVPKHKGGRPRKPR